MDDDVVLYRTQSGEVRACRPYCPHLGAHLGRGGWVDGEDLICPFHGVRIGERGSRAELHAPRLCLFLQTGALDRVQLASDFMTYVFVADDRWAERAVIAGRPGVFARSALARLRVMQAPDDSAREPEPAMRALADLMRRLQAIATDEQRHRIVVGVVEYLMATGCEILFRITGTRPTPADYRRLRESVMMMRSFCFAFIELVDQFELSDRLWMRPDVQQTARLASQVIGVTHDVFSSARERSWPGAVNLPLLLMQEHRCSWDGGDRDDSRRGAPPHPRVSPVGRPAADGSPARALCRRPRALDPWTCRREHDHRPLSAGRAIAQRPYAQPLWRMTQALSLVAGAIPPVPSTSHLDQAYDEEPPFSLTPLWVNIVSTRPDSLRRDPRAAGAGWRLPIRIVGEERRHGPDGALSDQGDRTDPDHDARSA